MSDTNKIIEKPKSMMGVLGAAFRVYKQVFINAFPLTVLCSLLLIVCFLCFMIPIHQFIYLPAPWLFLLAGLSLLFTHALLILRIHDLIKHQQTSLKALIKTLSPQYISLLAVSLITYVVSMLGHALLVVGVFLKVMLVFPWLAILFENQSIEGSLKMSWCLVLDNWWRTFTITRLVPVLGLITILFVCLLLLQTLINSMSLSNTSVFMLSLGISLLMTILFYPLFISLLITQFKDLQVRQKIKQAKKLAVNA